MQVPHAMVSLVGNAMARAKRYNSELTEPLAAMIQEGRVLQSRMALEDQSEKVGENRKTLQIDKQRIATLLWCADRLFKLANRLATATNAGARVRMIQCVDFSAYDETPMNIRGGSRSDPGAGDRQRQLVLPLLNGQLALQA
eukprot:9472178-Pyramimonas_sp.AAC.1